eukprot:Plantae.Rhodophyta-Rhodochaete_pulchella.ctg11946.p1 GENE.Plantae.Rhodophyta-Rhodochaete_pulchella.ctg11946~~Plantae.Rhodophyta-Rhodochaete_pulchella.ctg11946.p1  ORF type:complete len:270 (-),score=25.84 Plantae.Rhodophyta-Rhodochaete_pulchella.ctg11946:1862-2671(-)
MRSRCLAVPGSQHYGSASLVRLAFDDWSPGSVTNDRPGQTVHESRKQDPVCRAVEMAFVWSRVLSVPCSVVPSLSRRAITPRGYSFSRRNSRTPVWTTTTHGEPPPNESMVLVEDLSIPEDVLSELCEDSQRALEVSLPFVNHSRRDGVELSVVLCSDKYIRRLNKQWRGIDKATDVLSFPVDHQMLGDVVISRETADRQAEARGYTCRDEIRVLLVHGLLHLYGYNHEEDAAEHEEMQLAEKALLRSLGWKGTGLISGMLYTSAPREQ